LFNIADADWETTGRFEPPEMDLASTATSSGLLAEMVALLPDPHHDVSYNWPGCDLSGWPGGPPPPPPPAPLTPHTNLTGAWTTLHGGPAAIVQAADGSLTMPVFKPSGRGEVDGHGEDCGWFAFGPGENYTMDVRADCNVIRWSNKGVWHRVP
jgi:hypothetical protein